MQEIPIDAQPATHARPLPLSAPPLTLLTADEPHGHTTVHIRVCFRCCISCGFGQMLMTRTHHCAITRRIFTALEFPPVLSVPHTHFYPSPPPVLLLVLLTSVGPLTVSGPGGLALFPSCSVTLPILLAPCRPQALFRSHGLLKRAHPQPWYRTPGFVT